MSTEWLNRRLIDCPYMIALCLSEADYHSTLKRLKIKPENQDAWDHGMADAKMRHFLSADGKEMFAIVTVNPERVGGMFGYQIAAMLCHEAVHVFQRSCEAMGEKYPSDEFMAYSIQSIAQELMRSYVRQTAKRKGNSRRL